MLILHALVLSIPVISNELTAYQPLLESLLLVIAVLQTRNFFISFTETFISNITPAYK